MKLRVTTPLSLVVDADEVIHVRAEDETGAFGILPGHSDFVTVLTVSVISWRQESGAERHVAVRSGVLTVRDGERVDIASREAVDEDTLRRLGPAVLKRFQAETEAEESFRFSATRLQLATIRQLQQYLRSPHRSSSGGFGTTPAAQRGDDGGVS